MPTYSLSSRNQLRSPSGAVGEAPDGPGGIAALRDDVDNFLGVGGAEYCANAAALTAIPAARRFIGKLAYRADQDIVYRYVGNGNTALGAADTTHPWQAWQKPPTPYTPAFVNLGPVNASGLWGITDGIAWATVYAASASGFAITAGTDVTCSIPTTILTNYTAGRGRYYRGGLTSNTNVWDLTALFPSSGPIGTGGTFRVRALAQTGTAAGAPTSAYQLAAAVPSPYTGDTFEIEARSPCGLVA